MSTVEMNQNDLVGETGVNGADVLRENFLALRLGFSWWGTSKTLSTEQKSKAAESFGAEGKAISASKKLIDSTNPAYKAVTSVKTAVNSYFKSVSLPYPDKGVRLVRVEQLGGIDENLRARRDELQRAVSDLDLVYWDLKRAAQARLGSLYNESDYPMSLVGLFSFEWETVSLEPPEYLRSLNPRIYREQAARVQARFNEAAAMAEQAFVEEIAHLVDHLAERLTGESDGKPKIFRDTAITNFREFFDRFQNLNIGNNAQLEELVEQAESVLSGVNPQGLRDSQALRSRVSSQLSVVQSSLDGLLIDRPRRNIDRGEGGV